MFRCLIVAAAVALALPLATPAPALARSTSGSEASRLLGQMADYSQPHQAAMTEASNLVSYALEGMNPIVAANESRIERKTATGQVDEWAVNLQARVAALKAKRAALPPFPEATFRRLVELQPSLRGRVDDYRQVKVECLKTIDAAIAYAEAVIPLTRAAAAGDSEATEELVITTFVGTKLMLTAENAMLDVGIRAGEPNNPQTILARSVRASNAAFEVYLDYTIAELADAGGDPQTVAVEMRKHAATARAEARRVGAAAKGLEPLFRATPDADLRGRMLQILATFDESSRVELEIADVLDAAADLIASGKVDDGQLDAVLARLDTPIDRRLQLQERRLSLLKR